MKDNTQILNDIALMENENGEKDTDLAIRDYQATKIVIAAQQ